jgi:hypothetical protein
MTEREEQEEQGDIPPRLRPGPGDTRDSGIRTERPGPDRPERRAGFRELFLALRRGFALGRCRTCETFYLMAGLCLEEGAELLGPEERSYLQSWVEGGTVAELDAGCDGACFVIPIYSELAG